MSPCLCRRCFSFSTCINYIRRIVCFTLILICITVTRFFMILDIWIMCETYATKISHKIEMKLTRNSFYQTRSNIWLLENDRFSIDQNNLVSLRIITNRIFVYHFIDHNEWEIVWQMEISKVSQKLRTKLIIYLIRNISTSKKLINTNCHDWINHSTNLQSYVLRWIPHRLSAMKNLFVFNWFVGFHRKSKLNVKRQTMWLWYDNNC